MVFAIAADLVVVIHFVWILFIIGGFPLFLYLNSTTGRVLHLIALTITIGMQITRTICPLTYLEAFLKSKDQTQAVYPGSFLIEKLESLIYVEDVALEIISYLTIVFCLIVLLSFLIRPLRKKEQRMDLSNHYRGEPQHQPWEESNERHPDKLKHNKRKRPLDDV